MGFFNLYVALCLLSLICWCQLHQILQNYQMLKQPINNSPLLNKQNMINQNQVITPQHQPYYTPNSAPRSNAYRPTLRNPKQIEPTNKHIPPISDQQFYNNLKHYQPLFYNGEGPPFLLMNRNWYYNLPCILILDALIIMVLVVYLSNTAKSQDMYPQISQINPTIFIALNIVILVMVNILYFLTQFMNPGIVNLTQISEEEYCEKGKFYCIRCNGYRTSEMEHCEDCYVCLKSLDHHCGFFNKCIAGNQTYAFYGFLSFVFIGFISLLATLTSSV